MSVPQRHDLLTMTRHRCWPQAVCTECILQGDGQCRALAHNVTDIKIEFEHSQQELQVARSNMRLLAHTYQSLGVLESHHPSWEAAAWQSRHSAAIQQTSREPLVPVTDSEKRSTLAAKLMLTEAGLPLANLSRPTTVSGGGSSAEAL